MRIRTQILGGYFLVLLSMVVLAGVAYWTIRALVDAQQRVAHTEQVVAQARSVEKSVLDMETGERGFVITGVESFLEPYEDGIAQHDAQIAVLRQLVSDNPTQIEHLDTIAGLIDRWIVEAGSPAIAARRRVDSGEITMEDLSDMIALEAGKSIMDQLRVEFAEFEAEEAELMEARNTRAALLAARSTTTVLAGTLLAVLFGLVAGVLITRTITRRLDRLVVVADGIAGGDLDLEVDVGSADEIGQLASSMSRMQAALRTSAAELASEAWLKTGLAQLDDTMRGELSVSKVGEKALREIATYLDAQVAAIYLLDDRADEPTFRRAHGFACSPGDGRSDTFVLGDGLVGQAARDKKPLLVRDVPEDYLKVTSGLGEARPTSLSVVPLVYEDHVAGVLELGKLAEITDLQVEYLRRIVAVLGVSIEVAHARDRVTLELERSQLLAEELQSQQEELKATNEELEEQTQRLQQSEEELKTANEELRHHGDVLERQKRDVEHSRRALETKAAELSQASKYKSEFLANMSHELRTPLNSLLILAQMLSHNQEGNLTEDQVRSAEIIHSSGSDLLNLINEILDLAKIEAGRMDVKVSTVRIRDLEQGLRLGFTHVAADAGLAFDVRVVEGAPSEFLGDRQRVDQIVRNLVSNALKFTDDGGVTVSVTPVASGVDLSSSGLRPEDAFSIAVEDTGIGIEPARHGEVFEAFQQVDGTSARAHAGTGLGLSISRELAAVLGGEIQLESAPGHGSTFTLFLPIRSATGHETGEAEGVVQRATIASEAVAIKTAVPNVEARSDDRDDVEEGDEVILVIEDDLEFATILLQRCRRRGFKCLISATGEGGLELATRFVPQAVILDIKLPGMDGWAVLEALKDDPATRHIPVHIMSVEEPTIDARRKGAVGHLSKPTRVEDLDQAVGALEGIFSRKMKELLVVEDDDGQRESVLKLIGNGDVRATSAATGGEAIALIRDRRFDCVILDLGLPDMTGFELLEVLRGFEDEGTAPLPPIVVYTGRDLTREEEARLREYTESIIIKGVRSSERLLDEVSLFLHRLVGDLPVNKRKMIVDLHDKERLFADKRVLIVDDDMRNVFALSDVLTKKGLVVHKAESGLKALEILDGGQAVDLILMDIMMPNMDGYETTRRIRQLEHLRTVPIIAVTAKAMRRDREKCLEAGANDYLPKPVDLDRLLSMMRVWLYR